MSENTKTLSRLDLPRIVDALRELYRAIEHPPDENWQPPKWLIDQVKQTTEGELGAFEKRNQTGIIQLAKTEVLNRLTPPWHHCKADCPEITDSSLDQRHKVALISMRNKLLNPFFASDVSCNRATALEVLDYLESTISELSEDADKPHMIVQSQQRAGSNAKRRSGPGRQITFDPDADAKLIGDWQAAHRAGASRSEFCRKRGIEVKHLIHAQDRVRYHNGVGAE